MPHVTITNPDSKCHHRINYEQRGSPDAEHKVLFIMGLLTDGQAWQFQADHFADHPTKAFQIVCFDNRGVGMSDCPLERLTTRKLAEDALALADHLGWKEFHVVGVSMGGMISLELAAMAVHRVVSLSLFCTHAGGVTSLPLLPEAGLVVAKSVLARDTDARIHCAMELLYGKDTMNNKEKYDRLYAHHKRRLETRVAPKFIGAIGQLLAVGTHYVSYATLARIKAAPFPKLVMTGTEDKLVRKINSYILHDSVGGELVVLDGAGHGFLAERPEVANEHLEALFTRATKQRKALYDQLESVTPGENGASLLSSVSMNLKLAAKAHAHCLTDAVSAAWQHWTTTWPLP